uniref:E3 ubiquitin-protein ligase RNF26 n=1 Tax=Laticauda laticaudata TaxID=8630 RepID=A0A8C5WX65_LATLA
MDLVFLVINGMGMVLDLLVILLDINFFLVSSFLSILIWLLAFVYNLPSATVACLGQFWNGILVVVLCILEALYYFTLGSVHAVLNLLRGLCSSMESLKVLGHLFTHLGLRSKEIMHRGFWNLIGSGQTLLRQMCEVCAIAMSLVAYFINSIINICLIGTQNLFAAGLALWDTIVGPFLRIMDLLVAFLARLSSSAIAMAILLWTPCQLAVDLLASVSKLLINVLFVNLYGMVLLSAILVISIFILNPQLTWTLANQVAGYLNTMPSYHRLLRDMQRLYHIMLLSLEIAGGTAVTQRQALEEPYPRRQGPTGTPRPRQRGSRDQTRMDNDLGTATQQPQGEGPSASQTKTAKKEQLNALEEDNDPWQLLKEQEDRKKCVICQDQTKTVLLLPCRHLCLCQECTEILLQQAIYQRNCPLCRQMILQTLNVYL